MKIASKKLSQRILNVGTAFVLALSSVTASMPFISSNEAAALSASKTVCASICDYASLQDAINDATAGDTIDILGNLSTTAQVTVNKNLTIDGMGHTITPNFSEAGTSNNTVLEVIGTTDVIVKNLIIDGVNGTNLHGFQAYKATGVVLQDIESKNNDKTGVLVNGSAVTVDNLTTSGNGWHGVNVDQGDGVTSPAILTVDGVSHHSDTVHMFVDDVTKNVTVNDTNNQYAVATYGNSEVYTLKPTTPSITTPTSEQYFASSPIKATWSVSTGPHGVAGYQIAYHYDDGHSFGGSTCPGLSLTGYSGFIGCRDITTTSRDHTPNVSEQGGVTIWVRAIDILGIYGNWSDSVHYYYDATAPAAPTLVSPADGVVVNGVSITQSWSDTSSDVDHYVYESYNDSGATSLRWHQEYSSTSKTATHVAESTYWWRVKAVDHAGNVSGWSPLWKITVDNTAPTATIDNVAPKAYYNGATNISVHAMDANYAKTELYRNGDTTPFKTYTGSYFGLFWLADGHYRMDVIDQAGNMTEYTFTIDKTRPDVSFVTPTDFSTPFSLLSQIEISATDVTSGISGAPVVHVYHSNGTPAVFCSSTTCDTSGLADGDYYVKAGATDNAGNNKTVTEYFTVDSTAPVVDITAPSDGDLVHGAVTISGTVTDANPDHYYLVVKDSGNHVVAGPHTVYAANVADYNWDTTGVADGTYTIDLEARDAANNKDSNSVKTISVVVDNTSPVVTYVDSAKVGNVITPKFTANDINGPLTYSWVANDADSAANVTISDPTALNPDFTANMDGTYSFTLTATDAVGNTSTPQTFSFTYTTPAPTPTPTSSPTVVTVSTQSDGGTTGFTNVASTGNGSNDNGNTSVLGTQTKNTDNSSKDKNVLGTETSNKNDGGVWNIFGLAWYWWLLILAAVAALGRWLYGRFSQANA